MERFGDGRDWFFEDRFGLFIHWGLYAVNGWHEQDQCRRNISKVEYTTLADRFNPVKYDPYEWIGYMKQAGMTYINFITKHHDGFCMWDTQHTDYNIMNTPYKKDVLRMLVDACAAEDIKVCLYYSCPDWHHPNSVNQGGDHQLPEQNPGDEPDDDKYVDFVRKQVAELCTNYGKIHGFFWDIPPQRRDPSINEMIRKLQPGIMINDRGYDQGDYDTPERLVPEGEAFERATEACQSVGEQSWGYRENEDYYSHKFLMQSVDKILCMGGNYLINVGPKADGSWPPEAVDSIRRLGQWYKKVEPAMKAKPFTPFFGNPNYMVTRDGNTLYVHFHRDACSSGFTLNPLDILPKSVTLLNTGQPLQASVVYVPRRWFTKEGKREQLHIQGLPVNTLLDEVMVVAIEFEKLTDEYLLEVSQRPNPEDYIY